MDKNKQKRLELQSGRSAQHLLVKSLLSADASTRDVGRVIAAVQPGRRAECAPVCGRLGQGDSVGRASAHTQ